MYISFKLVSKRICLVLLFGYTIEFAMKIEKKLPPSLLYLLLLHLSAFPTLSLSFFSLWHSVLSPQGNLCGSIWYLMHVMKLPNKLIMVHGFTIHGPLIYPESRHSNSFLTYLLINPIQFPFPFLSFRSYQYPSDPSNEIAYVFLPG